MKKVLSDLCCGEEAAFTNRHTEAKDLTRKLGSSCSVCLGCPNRRLVWSADLLGDGGDLSILW